MEVVSFEISQDILAALKVSPDQLEQRMRLLAAIDYFREKKLSLGKAAELASMNRLIFMDLLAQQKLTVFDCDASVLTKELQDLERLRVDDGDH